MSRRWGSHHELVKLTESDLRQDFGDGHHISPLADPDDERSRSSPLAIRVLQYIQHKFVIFDWARSYSRADLAGDVRAGLTVSVVLVPQAIAYALLVEVAPINGLYASFVPLVVFAIFSTSRHMAIGPFALLSLVVASVVEGLVPADRTDAEYLSAVLTLSVLSGLLQIAGGFLGLGVIASFLADPCIAGFSTAVALVIMASQLKYLLGVPLHASSTVERLGRALIAFATGRVNWWALLVTVSAFAMMWATKRLGQRCCKGVPMFEQLQAVVFFTLLNYFLHIPVAAIGELPVGLPAPHMPALPHSLALWGRFLQGSAVVAFTSFLVSMSMARSFAAKHGYAVNANQELIALGCANLVGGCFQSFPVCGSFSRSAVVSQSGGRTQMHGMVQAFVIGLVTLWLTPLFRTLPYGVLAAIIFTALQSLVDFGAALTLWRRSRPDFGLWVAAFVSTLLFDVQVGLAVSLASSLGLIVLRSSRPRWVVLGRLPGTDIYRDVTRYPMAQPVPHVLVCRFDAPLHFANADFFSTSLRKRMRAMASAGDEPTHVVLDCSSIVWIDASANSVLTALIAELHSRNVAFILANSRVTLRECLDKLGTLQSHIGDNNLFVSLVDAVEQGCSRPRQPPQAMAISERRSSPTSEIELSATTGTRGPSAPPPKAGAVLGKQRLLGATEELPSVVVRSDDEPAAAR